MKLFFQCLGITGVIFLLYGFFAFAWTQVSHPFVWGLMAVGAVSVIVFVWKTLSREWQATVSALVALNAPWIMLSLGRDKPVWVIATVGCVSVVLLVAALMKRISVPVVAGAVALVAASYAGIWYFREKSFYNYNVLAASFVYIGIFIYVAKKLLANLVGNRSMQQGSSAAIYTAIFVAIVAVANVLSSDQHKQWDLTENKVSKLSEQSVQVIKGLKKPLKISVFMDDRNQQKPAVKDLLEQYRYETKNVEYTFLDPDKEKQLAVQNKVKDGDLLVEYEDQKNVTTTLTEEGITQAVLKVVKTSNPVVCFTKGHGELDLDAPEENPKSLSGIKGGLTNEGFKPKAVDSIASDIPVDCEVVVVAGALQAFTKDEAASFDRFLDKGGKAIVMADPNVLDPSLSPNVAIIDNGLEAVLQKWGVKLDKDFILEQHLKLLQGVQVEASVIAQDYGNHPIVEPMKGRNTVFHTVRSLHKVVDFKGTSVDLISSAGNGASWGETNIAALIKTGKAEMDANDVKGPAVFALAMEKEMPEKSARTKLVVFGDSDWVSNALALTNGINFDLFLNTLNWMQGDVEKISIRPKRLRTSTIELTPEQSNTIFYVAIILIPMLVLTFGMNLWWWRRRRG